MPEDEVIERAKRDEQQGKSPSTQAGELRAGRNGSYSRRKARRALAPTGHRDRTLEGTARGREAAAAQAGKNVQPYPRAGDTRSAERTKFARIEDIENALSSGFRRPETRGTFRGVARQPFPAGAKRCP